MSRTAPRLGWLRSFRCTLFLGVLVLAMLQTVAQQTAVAQMASGCDSPSDPTVPIALQVGQPVTIALDANATTGYLWLLAQPPDPAVLQVQQAEYRPTPATSASSGPLAGRGGLSCWTFLAVGPGETAAGFEYRRPFQLDQPPANSASFDIVVDTPP